MSPDERVPVCLTIAGSDSGGGAGIQADLKAFARCGVHGTCAITAITAQNTVGVELVTQVPGPTIVAQVHAVAEDIGVDAVKVGMLGDEPTIDAVVEALALVGEAPTVVDPVMVSASGATAARPQREGGADRADPARSRPWPRRTCPRRGSWPGSGSGPSAEELAQAIQALGPEAVVVTGGHSEDGADVLFDGLGTLRIDGPRFADGGVPRLGLHALVGARGVPRARRRARRGRALGAGDRLRGGGQRPRRHRRRAAGRSVLGRPTCGHKPGYRDEAPADEARPRRRAARRGRSGSVRGRGAPDRRVPPPARPRHVGGGADLRGERAARRPWSATSPTSRGTPSGSSSFRRQRAVERLPGDLARRPGGPRGRRLRPVGRRAAFAGSSEAAPRQERDPGL